MQQFTPLVAGLLLALVAGASLVRGADHLETVSDDDLMEMIKSETYVIVLFSKKKCDDCDRYESHLVNLKTDFRETLEANVVRVQNSQLVKLYSPTKEPALVFFRHGVPLLYDGDISEDAIFQLFENTKMPIVKELNDDIFEHLTQASTGSTTGDWFLQFYSSACVECQRLNAVWEAVGAALKSRMNVARINKDTVGAKTAQRFRVTNAPEFVLIRQGKFYRYEATLHDIKSFVSFAHEFYKNSKAEKVPVLDTPFDEYVERSVRILQTMTDQAKEFHETQPNAVYIVAGTCAAVILALVLCLTCRTAGTTADQKRKAKKAK